MLPTLANSGEVVVENRLSYRLFPNQLARGDLITLKSPIEPSRIICKRVIGLPGDTICVDPTGEHADPSQRIVIPDGHVWIAGDNAAHSRDSRLYGPVPIALIRGKLQARVSHRIRSFVLVMHSKFTVQIWPPRDITLFRNPTTFIECD